MPLVLQAELQDHKPEPEPGGGQAGGNGEDGLRREGQDGAREGGAEAEEGAREDGV